MSIFCQNAFTKSAFFYMGLTLPPFQRCSKTAELVELARDIPRTIYISLSCHIFGKSLTSYSPCLAIPNFWICLKRCLFACGACSDLVEQFKRKLHQPEQWCSRGICQGQQIHPTSLMDAPLSKIDRTKCANTSEYKYNALK